MDSDQPVRQWGDYQRVWDNNMSKFGFIGLYVERLPGSNWYIQLPRGGAIFIERAIEGDRPKSLWRPDVEKSAGEYRIWWRSFYAIFTPPGYKPQRHLQPAEATT